MASFFVPLSPAWREVIPMKMKNSKKPSEAVVQTALLGYSYP
jgi:hypothetical protein